MSNCRLLSSVVLASLVAGAIVAVPKAPKAQGLIDFLWGGSAEWGGGRQIVNFDPKYTPNQIIVSFGDRRLYLITAKGKAVSYPIAVPREQSRWQGTTIVSDKRVNPSWRPTPEMMRENPKLPSWVPGGHPMNPLGVRAMYLGASTYRIHGTDAPWTIGQAVSKGCIRMYNEDVLDLYPRVPVGTRVTVTWQQFSARSVAAYGDSPSPPIATPPFYKGSPAPRPRSIRNLPAAQPAPAEAVSAESRMPPPAPAAEETAAKASASKAKSKSAETAKAAISAQPAASASREATSAAQAATKAAEAAARAAEAAQRAAEAAKKAAADAKKATSGGREPEKTAAVGGAAL